MLIFPTEEAEDALRSHQSNTPQSQRKEGTMNTVEELENAIAKLKEWLKPRCEGRRTIFIYPDEIQEKLGLSEAVFWYSLFKLREQQIIGFEDRNYVGIYPAAIMIGEEV